MPHRRQYDVGDTVFHKTHGEGEIVRKTGPTFVRSMGEWMEATYLVRFGDEKNPQYVPSLYHGELRRVEQIQPA